LFSWFWVRVRDYPRPLRLYWWAHRCRPVHKHCRLWLFLHTDALLSDSATKSRRAMDGLLSLKWSVGSQVSTKERKTETPNVGRTWEEITCSVQWLSWVFKFATSERQKQSCLEEVSQKELAHKCVNLDSQFFPSCFVLICQVLQIIKTSIIHDKDASYQKQKCWRLLSLKTRTSYYNIWIKYFNHHMAGKKSLKRALRKTRVLNTDICGAILFRGSSCGGPTRWLAVAPHKASRRGSSVSAQLPSCSS